MTLANTQHNQDRLLQLFRLFERAAIAGARAPIADDLPSNSSALARELARAGYIKIRISGCNWRQIVILTGPYAGTKTMPDPHGHRVWREIGQHDLINGQPRRTNGVAA